MEKMKKPLLCVLQKNKSSRIPFWFMRQAGRYLPEYLELRKQAGSFLNLVYDPVRASEVTVQPLRRFGMDAAILFSDILIVPHALGQDVRFEAGEGPRLDALRCEKDFLKLDISNIEKKSMNVFETVALTSQKMKSEGFIETALIGFSGSPWTVICYMIEGHGSKDFAKARLWALQNPLSFQTLVDIVIEASCIYLSGQIKAGAEVVQLFESWSGVLDSTEFKKWVITPTKKIRDYLKTNHPDIPVIGFPRGAGVLVKSYSVETGIDCIALDQMVSPEWAVDNLQGHIPVQGNLDPVRLLVGGKALEDDAERIISNFEKLPFVFNLGHGIIKETPISHVEKLSNIIRARKLS